jgi:hypothetical protein
MCDGSLCASHNINQAAHTHKCLLMLVQWKEKRTMIMTWISVLMITQKTMQPTLSVSMSLSKIYNTIQLLHLILKYTVQSNRISN